MADTEDNLFRILFNAIPLPLFRVDREVVILDLNLAAQKLFNSTPDLTLRQKGGEIMHCLNASNPGGCGAAGACADCLIRNSVRQAFNSGREISRQRATLEIQVGETCSELDILLTATPIIYTGETSVLLCLEDISELTSLRALLPICASCKNIRDDQQLWNSVESYFAKFMNVDFTHGICPDCARRLYPDFYPKGKD